MSYINVEVPFDEIIISMSKSEVKDLLTEVELDEIATVKDFLDHYGIEEVLENSGEDAVKKWLAL